MFNNELIPSLFLFGLISGSLIGVAMLVIFMRRRYHRHPMDTLRGREIEDKQRDWRRRRDSNPR